jgi:hypothetical protein
MRELVVLLGNDSSRLQSIIQGPEYQTWLRCPWPEIVNGIPLSEFHLQERFSKWVSPFDPTARVVICTQSHHLVTLIQLAVIDERIDHKILTCQVYEDHTPYTVSIGKNGSFDHTIWLFKQVLDNCKEIINKRRM